jgi:hypothetical protein
MHDQIKTIFRTIKRENPYVQIDKTVINDPRLSWKAKGLMAFLLSKPDDWEVNVTNLIKQSRDGKDGVYSALKELIRYGYVCRRENRIKGRFVQVEYLIFENPQMATGSVPDQTRVEMEKVEAESWNEPLPGNPDAENPIVGEPETDKPLPENPDTVKPNAENPPPLNNINLLKNDFTKNSPPSNSPPAVSGGGDQQFDFNSLKPIAIKLFGQTNQTILGKLYREVAEFAIDDEVVSECVKKINISQIRHNPYGYFKAIYAATVASVNNRKQVREELRVFTENCQSQLGLTESGEPIESVAEARARARAILGIT